MVPKQENVVDFENACGGIANVEENTIIEAIVVDISQDTVFVDCGCKSEAQIPVVEFDTEPSINDKVKVFLLRTEGNNGQPVVSKKKADELNEKEQIKDIISNSDPVEGIVTGFNKGGFTVKYKSLIGFIPFSSFDHQKIDNPESYVNTKINFFIEKMEIRQQQQQQQHKSKNLKNNNNNKEAESFIGNRRKYLGNLSKIEKKKFLEERSVGETVKGVVKNITEYGAFIDINGVDALLHIKDISWSKTDTVKDILKSGDLLTVQILNIDKNKGKIAVGLKQLTDDPWTVFKKTYSIDDTVTGTISNIQTYGCFVKIIDGVDGFIHISDLSWTKNISKPDDVIKQGQKVNVKIINIDDESRKITLSLKHLLENPWDNASVKFAEGNIVKGKVKSLTSFGAFIELDEGIDALLHADDVSWTEKTTIQDRFKVGDELEVKVINFDKSKNKIKVGLKQLENNPWDSIESLIDKETNTIECTVLSSDEMNGVYVSLTDLINTYIPLKEIGYGRISENKAILSTEYPKGKKVKAFVQEFDKNKRQISLSVRSLIQKEEKKKVAEFLHHKGSDTTFTIGDMLKSKDK